MFKRESFGHHLDNEFKMFSKENFFNNFSRKVKSFFNDFGRTKHIHHENHHYKRNPEEKNIYR